MTKKSILPQHDRHVMVFDEDWEFLESHFGRQNGAGAIGASAAIRRIVHSWVERAKAKAISRVDAEERASK